MNDKPNNERRGWTAVVALLSILLVCYVLSSGPAIRMMKDGKILPKTYGALFGAVEGVANLSPPLMHLLRSYQRLFGVDLPDLGLDI